MKTLSHIHIRDPFVVPVASEKKYYLYGTTGSECWGKVKATGFYAHVSSDLKEWDGPVKIFEPPADFWSDHNFWAPEVHHYKHKYYLFASFKAKDKCRGTQILVADSPLGPFVVHSDGPITPRECECLDGTLYVDKHHHPWMIFCHEWTQVYNGRVCAMALSDDLREAKDKAFTLFNASTAPWLMPYPHRNTYVTDGPFVYKTAAHELLILWSSFRNDKYALGVARSASGELTGPWEHEPEPLFEKDGGHGMLFHTFEKQLMLALHAPNNTPHERPHFIPIREEKGRLVVEQ